MTELFMPMTINVDLTGFPSGQVINVYSAFIQTLYTYGFILKHPKYGWTFDDENYHKIKKIINKKDINLI